jgi:adenylate cyclase
MPALLTAERTGTLAHRESAGGTAQMLREGCDAIEAMAAERALVFVIDDLHWSDPATVDLLARLATRHGPSRLLVVGTYRPGDALRDGHPLTRVARELALHRWCAELALGPLDEADVRAYLEDLLGPDAMLPGLAGAIRRRTDGHPLFMVEVVADLARRGRLAKRGDRWQPNPQVAEADVPVPDTVRHLVEQTLDRLDPMSREILEVASVAGVDFPAAMVAAVLGLPAAAVDDACAELARQASFLWALGLDSPRSGAAPGLPTGTYRFFHALAREAVYDRIAPGRRAWLHRKLGELQERAGRTAARAPELARHFLEGRDGIRAARYLRQAAAVAMRGRRHAEAIVHLRAAAAALSELPPARRRARHELDVQVALGTALMLVKGYAAPEVEVAFSRARVLCHEAGNVPPPLPMLAGLWRYHQVAGNIGTAYDRARGLLERGRREGDPSLLLEAHRAMGMTLCVRGEPLSGQAHLEAGARLYEPESHGALARETEWDAGVMCLRYGALALWTVGLPDRARQQALRAIELARRSAHAPSLVAALVVGARLFQFRREPGRVRELAGEGLALAREHGFALRAAAATMLLGWARSAEGEAAEGLATLRAGFRAYEATGARDDRPYWLALVAEATGESGDLETAQRLVDEGLALARTEGLRAWEAELLRLRGDLALRAASRHAPARAAAGAEAALGQAVEIARSQAARTLELRAVTSLARLWQGRGRARTARDLLRRVYGEFGEGFDTADLRQARQVLEALPR